MARPENATPAEPRKDLLDRDEPVEPLLAIEGLTSQYGPVVAARAVDLDVNRGEIVALVGPIGAGKSTIMTTVMGLHPSSAGSIRFDAEDITGKPTDEIVRRGVSLIPERRRIFAELTVRENLQIGAAARGDRSSADAEMELVLELFPALGERIDGAAGYLSGGEAQQLAIARALVGDPTLLLLDEPSLGLAPKIAQSVFELLSTLRERGLTLLLVEQNAFQALEIADRGYVLRGGTVALAGTSAELLEDRRLIESYLGVRSGGNGRG